MEKSPPTRTVHRRSVTVPPKEIPMDLGIHIWRFDCPRGPASIAPTLSRAAEAAESAGVHSLSVMDHYFQMEASAPAEQPMLEGYTTLGYLAAHTSQAQLRLLVTGVTYRYPGLLAKIVSTLDVLSEGRAQLGIGAAWYEREHQALGVPYPPLAERFERLEETLRICLQMWDPDDVGPFDGRYYQLAETLCSPLPLSRPHPPIVIGGTGERKTLRLVAQYADACNLFAPSPDFVAQKLDVLRRHCDEVGRDPATVRKTILATNNSLSSQGDVGAFAEEMRAYAALGVEEAAVMPPDGQVDSWIEKHTAEAAARLAEL
jgi:F420-dependent oxidoreductase-like protein